MDLDGSRILLLQDLGTKVSQIKKIVNSFMQSFEVLRKITCDDSRSLYNISDNVFHCHLFSQFHSNKDNNEMAPNETPPQDL